MTRTKAELIEELVLRLSRMTTEAEEKADAAAGVEEGAVTTERRDIDALVLKAREVLTRQG
jgi:hypothetical protein